MFLKPVSLIKAKTKKLKTTFGRKSSKFIFLKIMI